MKKTVEEKLNNLLERLKERASNLELNILQYAENGNYEAAAKTQVKIEQLEIFISNLEDILN